MENRNMVHILAPKDRTDRDEGYEMLYYQEYKFYKSALKHQKVIFSIVLEELDYEEINAIIYEFNYNLDLEKQEEIISTVKKIFGDLYKKAHAEALKAIQVTAPQLN